MIVIVTVVFVLWDSVVFGLARRFVIIRARGGRGGGLRVTRFGYFQGDVVSSGYCSGLRGCGWRGGRRGVHVCPIG